MHVSLRPETQRYIDEQLQTGRFPSLDAMIEAAVAELREVDESLDADTVSAIHEADAQAGRGEGVDLDTFSKADQHAVSRLMFYIVYFRVLKADEVIRVLHVRHASRRPLRRFDK